MGKRIRKGMMAGIIALMVFQQAGCEEQGRETESRDPAGSGAQTEDASGEDKTRTKNAVREDAPSARKELRQAAALQFIPNGIRSVSLKKDGQEFLYISREPAVYKMNFDYWEILNPYDENATMNTEVMFEMFEELCSLTFTAPARIDGGADAGIGDSDMGIRVEYVDTIDDSRAKSTDEADTAVEIILGKEDGNGGRYAALSGNEDEVFILPEETLRRIYARKPFDYILKIPVLISADSLKAVEISANGRTYRIGVDTAGDSYSFGKKKVKKEEFAALYQAISGIRLVSEMDPGEKRKEEPVLSVDFCRNTKDAPAVCVSYYHYDEEFDSVEIDGEERFLVRKEEIEDLAGQIEEAF